MSELWRVCLVTYSLVRCIGSTGSCSRLRLGAFSLPTDDDSSKALQAASLTAISFWASSLFCSAISFLLASLSRFSSSMKGRRALATSNSALAALALEEAEDDFDRLDCVRWEDTDFLSMVAGDPWLRPVSDMLSGTMLVLDESEGERRSVESGFRQFLEGSGWKVSGLGFTGARGLGIRSVAEAFTSCIAWFFTVLSFTKC